MKQDKLKINLAEYAYNSWIGWMKYLFAIGKDADDGSFIIPKEIVAKWKRQMTIPFYSLDGEEQFGAYEEADKILEIIDYYDTDWYVRLDR